MNLKITELPKFEDLRGNLSAVEELCDIPFKIEQVFWMYDISGGQMIDGKAFKQNQQFIIALSGSFDIVIDDASSKCVFSLNRSYKGLYIPNGFWYHIENFSTNSLVLVISSTHLDTDDCITEYNEFIDYKNKTNEK